MSQRIASGGRILRDRPISMPFDGKALHGYEGDTVASALLARGERVVGRSFKYHRPRGILAAGVEEPNALLTVGEGASQEPNLQATTLELHESLQARTQNAWPSLRFDLMGVNSLFAPILSAGFYYKTFIGPTRRAWMFYEHFIRRAAGLGRASEQRDAARYEHRHDFVDVLVVGSGPAGLGAALAAARSGADVMLVEQDFALGGSLLAQPVDSAQGQWLDAMLGELASCANVQMLSRATAFGLYDGNTVGVLERTAPGLAQAHAGVPKQRMRIVRAGAIVLACGAIERPLVFPGNDLPGVMLSSAVGSYVNRFAVRPGQHAVFAVNNDAAYLDAMALAGAGARVLLLDARAEVADALQSAARAAKVEVRLSSTVTRASGWQSASSCEIAPFDLASGAVKGAGERLAVDLIAMSGGWTPTVHLSSHRNARPVYRADISCFVPGALDRRQFGAGAMMGVQNLQEAIDDGWRQGVAAASSSGRATQTVSADAQETARPALPDEGHASMAFTPMPSSGPRMAQVRGKAFVDFQNDVTTEDVQQAHLEGYQSVEHLKRYTTLGMGTEQGKTSNMSGLSLMAQRRAMEIPEVGTTTFRPPFTPVSIGALAGRHTGAHFQPVRRTAMHDWHITHGGQMMEAGLWMRPLWYNSSGPDLSAAYKAEMDHVRECVGVADVSTLGKIDVQGPDAAEFLNRVYVNGFAKLPVGKARYGFMLREDGMVLDDGTTSRIGETEFFMTTTTAQAARVMSHLEFLLQVVWPELRVTVASISDQWAAMSVAGPKTRDLLRAAFPQIDFSNEAIPHMGLVEATVQLATPARAEDPSREHWVPAFAGTTAQPVTPAKADSPVTPAQPDSPVTPAKAGVQTGEPRGNLHGVPVRIIRLTFSGELAYEVYTHTHHGLAMWEHLFEVGQAFDLRPYGLEALGSLRIEKGHVVGSEMDGRTTLDDMGQSRMASQIKPFWGDALRRREELMRTDRPVLVGLEAVDEASAPNNGAILFFLEDEIKGHGRGHITSTTYSKELGKAIGLGLLEGGTEHVGKEVIAASPVHGRQYRLRVVSPQFLDEAGERYRV